MQEPAQALGELAHVGRRALQERVDGDRVTHRATIIARDVDGSVVIAISGRRSSLSRRCTGA